MSEFGGIIRAVKDNTSNALSAGVAVSDVGAYLSLAAKENAANIVAKNIRDNWDTQNVIQKGHIVFKNGFDTKFLFEMNFQYNPTVVTKNVDIGFNVEAVPGGTNPILSYMGQEGAIISFDLFFFAPLESKEKVGDNFITKSVNYSDVIKTKYEEDIEEKGLVATYLGIIENMLRPQIRFEPPAYVHILFSDALYIKGYIRRYSIDYLQFDKNLKPTMARMPLEIINAEIRKSSRVTALKNNSDVDKQKAITGPKLESVSGWITDMKLGELIDKFKVNTWADMNRAMNEGELSSKQYNVKDVVVINGFKGMNIKGNLIDSVIERGKLKDKWESQPYGIVIKTKDKKTAARNEIFLVPKTGVFNYLVRKQKIEEIEEYKKPGDSSYVVGTSRATGTVSGLGGIKE